MTSQWIITLLILTLAVIYAIWRIIKYFRKGPGRKTLAAGCDDPHGDCAHCLEQQQPLKMHGKDDRKENQ